MIRPNPAAARPTEAAEMDGTEKDAELFFSQHRDVYPLCSDAPPLLLDESTPKRQNDKKSP